ncbi:MAG: hypothetical protein R3E32_03445 [Chitinophagales bacterium]
MKSHLHLLLLFLCSIFSTSTLLAQLSGNKEARDWWINNVNWDGNTHWSAYLIQSPAYMGPNALPVPSVSKGVIDNQTKLRFSLQTHFSNGDDTQNPFLSFNYAVAPKKIAFFAFLYPIEHFAMSNKVRDERRLSDAYFVPRGFAAGDLYFGAAIQILKNKQNLPDIALRMTTKTASGGAKGGSRNTDAPGYYFDLSLGKKWFFNQEDEEHSMSIYSMLGLFVWETNALSLPQNDALLFGIGTDIHLSKYTIHSDFGGFWGYKNNGDRPIIYRFGIDRAFGKGQYLLKYQAGIHDFPYNSFEAGIVFYLTKQK